MGRHRYYCSHCDTSFPYTPRARQQHYTGAPHRAQAARHYRAYRTAAQRLREEEGREGCRQHARGACCYGDACKYSHVTPGELEQLTKEAREEAVLAEYGPLPSSPPSDDSAAVERLLSSVLPRRDLARRFPHLILPEEKVNVSASSSESSFSLEPSTNPVNPSLLLPSTNSSLLPPSTNPSLLAPSTPLPPSLQWYPLNTLLSQPLPQWG